ncbi:N-formylglutamate amidohydrolase [Allorhodopirellula solitaria]|uniref:N-formylglutamate amidohydrolase n=1 Tax=Allorhodopirellula solitaria TaxID=2527987 RepID=A0A5C5YF02_9BACT|nr:N-formylglutamate amidohydrolase [Allorhodopirellula solitaria]TWT73383.1 N-formylglutamate amidohydrolase [Allorhodopirellula solitaria]
MSLLITCDTGGWKTPSRLRSHLEGTELSSAGVIAGRIGGDQLLRPAVDREANFAARRLAHRCGGVVVCNEYRGDLINVGHSLHHRQLFPAGARALPTLTREVIVQEIYTPYRNRVQRQLLDLLRSWSYVVHLSIRTFAAKTREGHWRRGDVGLLYDPARQDETDWCLDLIDELYLSTPDLKVRRNHPGRGTNDSLTKSLRMQFSPDVYLGIEIVLNRAWMGRSVLRRDQTLDLVGDAVGELSGEPIERAA